MKASFFRARWNLRQCVAHWQLHFWGNVETAMLQVRTQTASTIFSLSLAVFADHLSLCWFLGSFSLPLVHVALNPAFFTLSLLWSLSLRLLLCTDRMQPLHRRFHDNGTGHSGRHKYWNRKESNGSRLIPVFRSRFTSSNCIRCIGRESTIKTMQFYPCTQSTPYSEPIQSFVRPFI